ncbi:HlyD family efflux transporter periplasmic adaptor subunit [Limnohabitans sp.]|uniref:efflux RND transporter periplasmic adaptor subunit n=1 Tax=Limnohabitans sp. TaxID=1907725 RepID=UPI0033401A18
MNRIDDTSTLNVKPPGRWHPWRWLAWSAAGLLGLGALGWSFAPRPLVVEVASVTQGPFEQSIEEDGQLRLKARFGVAAPMAGQLLRPSLQVGDRVEKNQVLAWLAPMASPLIDPRNQNVLRQRVGRDEATQQAARARVAQLQAALEQARLQTRRAEQLAQQDFIAIAALDQALNAESTAAQALEAGHAEWRAAQFSLAESQAALGHTMTTATAAAAPQGLVPISSPISGQVVKLHLNSAGPVTAGQALIDIGDVAALEAVIDVLSSDARHIPVGAPVTLLLDGRQDRLDGRVRRVEPSAFTRVSALGIEEQRVNVLVDLLPVTPADAQGLGDGFRVEARIVLSRVDQALRVPSAALVRSGEDWRVWIMRKERVQSRKVLVKDRNAEFGAIEPGPLQAGDLVVLYPAALREGQRVKAMP